MPVLSKPVNDFTISQTQVERDLGVDLQLGEDGDLILGNNNDLQLVTGASNAAQAVRIRLGIQPGGLLYHPEIGVSLQIGSKTVSASRISNQIQSSIASDDRFENVRVRVQIQGSVVLVDLTVSIVDTGIEIPLQFAAVA